MKIGYIGLGNMGAAIARRLLLRQPLTVFDRQPDAVAALVADGALAARDARSLAAECSIVLMCLPTSGHVRSALFGEGGFADALRPGSLLIDMTTGDPAEARAMAAELDRREIAFADAPVAGGPHGAEAGTLAIFVGATPATFERARRILEGVTPRIFHAGEPGTGDVMKLVNNMIASSTRAITFEAMTMAVKNGISLETLARILPAGSARSYQTEVALPRLREGRFAANFTVELMLKDLRLATKLGQDSGSPMLIGNLVRELYQALQTQLGPSADVDMLLRYFERQSGVTVVPDEAGG